MTDFITNDGFAVGTPSGLQGHRVMTVDDDLYLDCPVLNKTRSFSIPRGLQAILEWQIRNKRTGQGIDISDLISNSGSSLLDEGQVIFRFTDCWLSSTATWRRSHGASFSCPTTATATVIR